MKILIDNPGKEQILLDAKDYLGEWLILWHERDDGSLPVITLGGMTRVGDTLVFDQARKDQHDVVIVANDAEKIRLEEIETEVKQNTAFNNFKNMTNVQQNDWWAGLAAAGRWQVVLWILRYIARRQN